jgi:hypothetical protein
LEPHIEQAVGSELDVMVLIGGAEEQAVIHLVISTWLRKMGEETVFRGHMSKRGEERSSGHHLNMER